MTAATSSVIAERAGYSILKASFANIDGAQANDIGLPAGFGDCVVDWVIGEVGSIATMMANPEISGFEAELADQGLIDVRDHLGYSRWLQLSATALVGRVQPAQGSAMWYMSERLYVRHAEVDTNAVPTADLTIVAKVRRLREP